MTTSSNIPYNAYGTQTLFLNLSYRDSFEQVEKQRIKSDLATLKNKMTGAYFLINSLWIVLTFSLNRVVSDINITLLGMEVCIIRQEACSLTPLIDAIYMLLISRGNVNSFTLMRSTACQHEAHEKLHHQCK